MHTEDNKLHDNCSGPNDAYVNLPVQEVVKQVHEGLRLLLRQRTDVVRRIGTVRKTVVGLASMFGDSVLNEELKWLLNRGKPPVTSPNRALHSRTARQRAKTFSDGQSK